MLNFISTREIFSSCLHSPRPCSSPRFHCPFYFCHPFFGFIPHPTATMESNNQSPNQQTSDSNLCAITIAILIAHHLRMKRKYHRDSTVQRLKELEDKDVRNRPPISYIPRHGWSMDNPGDHFFHSDQDFVEYLRYVSVHNRCALARY